MKTYRLGDLGKIVTGTTPPKAHPEWFASSGLPFVTPSDIKAKDTTLKTARFISRTGLGALRNRVLPPKAISVVCIGSTIGKMSYLRTPVCTNQQINSLIVDTSKASNRFLYYRMWEIADSLKQVAGGSASPIVNKTAFSQLKIDLPDIQIQQGIAATLGALDDKIESNKEIINLFSSILDSYSQAWSMQVGTCELSALTRLSKERVVPSKLREKLVDHYSLPAFDNGQIPERVKPESILSTKSLIDEPSILVSRLNPRINRTWWVEPSRACKSLCSTEFAVLQTKDPETLASVWLAVRDPYFIAQTRERVTGTSGSHQRIRPEDLLSIEVPDFTQLDRNHKAQALNILRKIKQLGDENLSLAKLRDTLLPELMAGRIRVPEAQEAIQDATNNQSDFDNFTAKAWEARDGHDDTE